MSVTADPADEQWLVARNYVRSNHHTWARAAAQLYDASTWVDGTPLLSTDAWLPDEPVPLADLELQYEPDAAAPGVTGTEEVVRSLLPEDGGYRRYSDAVAALAAPRLYENRATYRLVGADLKARTLAFGPGHYFDHADVGDACAHEFVSAFMRRTSHLPLRAAVGEPCDPARRPTNLAISTLTIRADRSRNTFLLHRRDAAAVGHAGDMFQVLPVGVFQPVSDQPPDVTNDFSLWRSMIREYAEELLGEPEPRATVDYETWPFAVRMNAALAGGSLRAHVLGIGVDPLTLATDLLAAVVIDAPAYDELFPTVVPANDEGTVRELPFTEPVVELHAGREPTQPAGAALLRRAWHHRAALLG